MKLEALLRNMDYELLQGDLSQRVRGIEHDSRKIGEEDLFVAIEGYESDGHEYIKGALKAGNLAQECHMNSLHHDPELVPRPAHSNW